MCHVYLTMDMRDLRSAAFSRRMLWVSSNITNTLPPLDAKARVQFTPCSLLAIVSSVWGAMPVLTRHGLRPRIARLTCQPTRDIGARVGKTISAPYLSALLHSLVCKCMLAVLLVIHLRGPCTSTETLEKISILRLPLLLPFFPTLCFVGFLS